MSDDLVSFRDALRNVDLGDTPHRQSLSHQRFRLQLKYDSTRWRTGGEVKGKWRIEWVASTFHTTSEHGVSSITTADAHTSPASSPLNWRPRRFKWTRPFRPRKTKYGFCACAITFQMQSVNQFSFRKKLLSQSSRRKLHWEPQIYTCLVFSFTLCTFLYCIISLMAIPRLVLLQVVIL